MNRSKLRVAALTFLRRQLPILRENCEPAVYVEIGTVRERRKFERRGDLVRQNRIPVNRQGPRFGEGLDVAVMKGLAPSVPQRCRHDVNETLADAESPYQKPREAGRGRSHCRRDYRRLVLCDHFKTTNDIAIHLGEVFGGNPKLLMDGS